ncbi:alpha/beta fold hydrolase [Micromonospora thermarum]|uniref:alpha/beta fold hydrolase n=1 Tax=Micromonospora thermarum TaxID=2720024 RepID=UPI0028151663|nr:alpha/beta hydrolase [Micromonospora thermarum]
MLVHGGFADATNSWEGEVKRLQDQGYPVVAPANPLRGLATDSAYLASVLDSIEGPIVLVGHSYGGAVITNAAANDPDVKALVYIAAFVPDTGESLGELISKYPGSEIEAALNHVPYPNPDGSTGTDLYLKADKFRAVFAADLPESTTTVMSATQRPFSAQAFADPTQGVAWRTIPSWGLVATADKAIPADLQRFEYNRAGARKIVEVEGASHSVMASQPGAVTKLITEAANATD